MATYKCPALGECEFGMTGKIIERAPGEDLRCPQCGSLMDLQSQNDSGGKKLKPPVIAAIVGAAVLVIGGGTAFYCTHPHKSAQEGAEAAQAGASVVAAASAGTSASASVAVAALASASAPDAAPAPASATAPLAVAALPPPASDSAAAGAGIAPSTADIAADRKAGDKQLINGDAAGAETASNRAAAKEMIKVAIADMAQGKLDEAEKELDDAQARDPKQSLVYYNLGVLRLKQSRTDDALKAFEASFLNGFEYFDAMAKDPDLEVIRHDPRFEALVKKYRPGSA